MNWKKFITECQEVRHWLAGQGYCDPQRILLQTIILLLRGYLPPADAVRRAITLTSPQEAVLDKLVSPPGFILVPKTIEALISGWAGSLPHDIWLLGEVHERLAAGRRIRGLVYTAPEIIDFILTHTVETADIVKNPQVKVLDPACGCGYFLLKAYDVLWRKFTQSRSVLAARYPELDWSDEGIHRHILTHNLWGADIDPLAADLAAAGLLLKRPEANGKLRPNIVVCDSLRRSQADAVNPGEGFWSAKYHYVIGNPPYVSFGLRGAKRLEPDYERYLRYAYPDSAEYKLSYYALFLERGIELLVQAGKLGFIVPDSFLLGRYYSKIRRHILEHTAIDVLAHIASPGFKNATVGMSAICILTKQPDSPARANHLVKVCQAAGRGDLCGNLASCRYNQNYFAALPYQRFRIFSDLTVKSLVDKIDNSSEPLGNFSSGHTGVRSVTKQRDIVAVLPAGPTWQRGLASGGQVLRYGLVDEGHWLNIEPGALYKGGWDPLIVKQRKMLVRQTGYTLTVCVDDQGFYHLNNIHSFILKSSAISLDYLLILLNSSLMSFYYHAVAMEYGRAMAQTDIETLELLPVRMDAKINIQAPALAAQMNRLVQQQIAGNAVADEIAALDNSLNRLVYRIYDLTDFEVACLEGFEAKLAASSRRPRLTAKSR